MKKSFLFTLLFIVVACLAYDAHDRWKGDWWRTDIHSDGYGYYAYLPCVFIYHHFDYDKVIRMEKQVRPETPDEEAEYCFPYAPNGKRANKCFIGVAILLIPFFLIAYLLSAIFGYDLNGYSPLFQLSVSLASMVYLVVGLIYIRKLLLEYNVKEWVISLVLITIVLGTNLFYYSTIEAFATHPYSFGIMAVFIYYTKRALTNYSFKNITIMAVSLAILALIRPTNLLAVCTLPLLAGDVSTFKGFFKNLFTRKESLIAFVISAGFIVLQLLTWYFETGHLFYWSYLGERFYFGHPKMIDILFSYHNGWFVYTPIMFFVVVTGSVYLYKNSKLSFAGFWVFFLAITYVMSCWYSWYYGGFGHRGYIEYYPVFALLMGLVLNSLKSKVMLFTALLLGGLCILVSCIQTHQYTNFILSKNMDKDRYWQVFLKLGSKYVNSLDPLPPKNLHFYEKLTYADDFENPVWANNLNSVTMDKALNGRFSARVNERINNTPEFKIPGSWLPVNDSLCVFVRLWGYMPDTNSDAALEVIGYTTTGGSYTITMPLKDSIKKANVWKYMAYTFHIPSPVGDTLQIFVHGTKGTAYIDDERIDFATGK